jgi:hypothetical protein
LTERNVFIGNTPPSYKFSPKKEKWNLNTFWSIWDKILCIDGKENLFSLVMTNYIKNGQINTFFHLILFFEMDLKKIFLLIWFMYMCWKIQKNFLWNYLKSFYIKNFAFLKCQGFWQNLNFSTWFSFKYQRKRWEAWAFIQECSFSENLWWYIMSLEENCCVGIIPPTSFIFLRFHKFMENLQYAQQRIPSNNHLNREKYYIKRKQTI